MQLFGTSNSNLALILCSLKIELTCDCGPVLRSTQPFKILPRSELHMSPGFLAPQNVHHNFLFSSVHFQCVQSTLAILVRGCQSFCPTCNGLPLLYYPWPHAGLFFGPQNNSSLRAIIAKREVSNFDTFKRNKLRYISWRHLQIYIYGRKELLLLH